MSNFTSNTLLLTPSDTSETWILSSEIEYRYGSKDSYMVIRVPVGFETDGASTGFLRGLLPQWGLYTKAAIIHDYLYRFAKMVNEYDNSIITVDRELADEIFLEAMEVCGVSRIKRNIMFWGVRLFGWWEYKPTYSLDIEPTIKFLDQLKRHID